MTTAICAYFILGLLEGLNCPPPIHQMALSLTNYWTMDEHGNYIPWNGNADDTPHLTANGTLLTPEMEWASAACIGDWTFYGWTTAVHFQYGGEFREVACNDEFGRVTYRRPFYHEGYQEWVIPVDVFSPEPIHVLIHDWHTSKVRVKYHEPTN